MRFIRSQIPVFELGPPCGTWGESPAFHPGATSQGERGKRCGGMKENRLLRETSLPRYALRRDEAATSISISPSLFDQWIELGLMPKGRKIRGVVLWDTEELQLAWRTVRDAADENNPKAPGETADQVLALV